MPALRSDAKVLKNHNYEQEVDVVYMDSPTSIRIVPGLTKNAVAAAVRHGRKQHIFLICAVFAVLALS